VEGGQEGGGASAHKRNAGAPEGDERVEAMHGAQAGYGERGRRGGRENGAPRARLSVISGQQDREKNIGSDTQRKSNGARWCAGAVYSGARCRHHCVYQVAGGSAAPVGLVR